MPRNVNARYFLLVTSMSCNLIPRVNFLLSFISLFFMFLFCSTSKCFSPLITSSPQLTMKVQLLLCSVKVKQCAVFSVNIFKRLYNAMNMSQWHITMFSSILRSEQQNQHYRKLFILHAFHCRLWYCILARTYKITMSRSGIFSLKEDIAISCKYQLHK